MSGRGSVADLYASMAASCANLPRWWSVLSSYFDESGTHDGSVAVSLAGYSAFPEVWSRFDPDWLGILSGFNLDYFHMADFVRRAIPFDQLTDEERPLLIKSLVECICDHQLAGTAVVLKRSDYQITGMHTLTGVSSDPYFYLMIKVIMDVAQRAFSLKERVLFTFDRKAKVAGLAERIHDTFLVVHPWSQEVLSDQTVFGSKQEYRPLQAADILAYETYRRGCDFSAVERKSLSALRTSFKEITVVSAAELAFFSNDPRLREAAREIFK